jgi:predicted 3-demethylubiquinone-9 3-methyltransferase (glyoxalase superfamily)
MKPLTHHLFFDGNCREAMEFYKACLRHSAKVAKSPCRLPTRSGVRISEC